jgi:SAM-dependent methyltransferase
MSRDTQAFWDSREESASIHDAELGWGQVRFAEMVRSVVRGRRVLDCGSGAGAYSQFLTECGAHVTGLDFSAAMVRAARSKFPAVEFLQGNILTVDLKDQFDIITGSAFLHEIDSDDTPRLLEVFAAHLAPGGFGWFQENSFFNPAARFLRNHVVGRYGIPKHGSPRETPFDPERWAMYRRRFRYCERSAEAFVLFSRVWSYLIRKGSPDFWIALDKSIGTTPGNRVKRYWSYIQHIYFSNDQPKQMSLRRPKAVAS